MSTATAPTNIASRQLPMFEGYKVPAAPTGRSISASTLRARRESEFCRTPTQGGTTA